MTLRLLWVSLAFLAGIAAARVLRVPYYLWLAAAVVVLLAMVLASRFTRDIPVRIGGLSMKLERGAQGLALAALAAACLGAARYELSIPPRTDSQIFWYNDADYEVLVSGTLVEPPDIRDTYIHLRLRAREIDTGADRATVHGLVLARTAPNQEFHYGDHLRLRGRLVTPPSSEDFSYRDYLARQGIRSYMSRADVTRLPGRGGNLVFRGIYALKEESLRNVYRLFVDPEASLLAGILLGVDSGIPPSLEQAFNDTGTSHIIAISGFNIAVVAGVLAFLFNRLLGPRRGALVALAGILLYAFFVGADPPVVRAAITGSVAILAMRVGRRQTSVNTLAFVAALMALFNPLLLWNVGFQLSLLATLGLILYGVVFMEAAQAFIDRHIGNVEARKLASPLSQFVVLTFAAQLTTLPIIAYHFKQISVISPLANAFILPAQPAVMILGGLAVSVSLLIYPLGQALAWMAWPLTAYTIRTVEIFSRVPQAVIYLGDFSLLFVALFYGALLAVTFAGGKLKASFHWLLHQFRYFWLTVSIISLFACALLTWRLAAAAPDGKLHITFLSVGSADAVLLETPSGARVLVNGGPSAATLSDALGRRLSPIDHRLAWLVVASTDEAQVGSLPPMLLRFPPANVLMGGPEQASSSSAALVERLAAREIPMTQAERGQTLDLGDGAVLRVIDVSSRGSTLLLEWGEFRVLLPIGANLDTLEVLELGKKVGPVSVLLMAQSGYGPLAPREWLQNLSPRLAVISVDSADRDGLPSPEALEVLEDYAVLRTDETGWIEVVTDGSQMWVSSERPATIEPP